MIFAGRLALAHRSWSQSREDLRPAMTVIASAIILISCNVASADEYPPVLSNERNQFVILKPTKPAPETRLAGLDGGPVHLGQFSGRIVLLNFWASWCAPCAFEMPTLDALAARLPKDRFAVVAVSLDQDDGRGVRTFLRRHPLHHVTVLLDPHHRLGTLSDDQTSSLGLAVHALPSAYVLDKDGKVRGYLAGPADWNSAEARALIDYYLEQQ